MKKLLLLVLVLVSVQALNAQTFNEWFRQKKTQKKYLLQQIAALKVYLGYVKGGYKIVKEGADLVGDIKNGEFNLHKDYFNSLKNVNPAIQHSDRISDIIHYEAQIETSFSKAIQHFTGSAQFTSAELHYLNAVHDRVLDECNSDLEELEMVLTPNKLEMKDDERIQRLDQIHKSMLNKYEFTRSFLKQVNMLAMYKQQHQQEIQKTKKLYNIND